MTAACRLIGIEAVVWPALRVRSDEPPAAGLRVGGIARLEAGPAAQPGPARGRPRQRPELAADLVAAGEPVPAIMAVLAITAQQDHTRGFRVPAPFVLEAARAGGGVRRKHEELGLREGPAAVALQREVVAVGDAGADRKRPGHTAAAL